MFDLTLRLPRSIRDPLHGTIRLSNDEVQVLDHSLFRRLHRVRQNGLLYLVFPSASHTRFEHSLGVLHVASSIFLGLIRNSFIASNKADSSVVNDDCAQEGQAISFHDLEDDLLEDLFRLTRLAGLVHDLGHGPFSHTFDSFAPLSENISEVIATSPELQPISGLSDHLEGDRIEHEEMSCILFSILWHEIEKESCLSKEGHRFNVGDVPGLISAIVLGKPMLTENDELRKYTPLIHDIVASSPVDADRMDYLERDSRSIGVTYGLFDKERLVKSFLVYKGRFESEQTSFSALRLGVKQSGLRAVENFVQARFELFVQIYYHKTNRSTQIMLEKIAGLIRCNGGDIFAPNDVNHLKDIYCGLSDEAFMYLLQNGEIEIGGQSYALPEPDPAGEIGGLARGIASRKLWKRICEDVPHKIEAIYAHLSDEFSDEFGGSHDIIKKDKIEPKATKGLNEGARLLERGSQNIYQVSAEAGDWLKQSPMMKALTKEEKVISRIYFKGDDSHLLKRLRTEARNFQSETSTETDDDQPGEGNEI